MQLNEIQDVTDSLALMPDAALQQYAQMHKDDPYVMSLAMSESNRRKKLRAAQQGQAGQMPQPKVVDQAIAAMNPPPQQKAPQMAPQTAPQDQGIAQLPTPNLQGMADGGIAGYDEEDVKGMARGGDAGSDPFAAALILEGITDPRQIAYLRSIHGQESGGGKNTKTSNRGAVGGMQILPDTFNSVADAGMDIKDPVDNARAGIRYAMQGYQAARGNPTLAAAYYYGGPSGLEKAKKGVAVSDPKNPNNPNTLEYGKSIAKRMTDLLPIGSAQAAPVGQATPGQRVVNGYVVDQFGIPLYKAGETPNTTPAKDERSIFEKGADYIGISPEVQRNVSNTLNALGGYSAPAAGITKLVSGATPEAVAAAGAAAQKANTLRLAPPVAEGIAALAPEAQATRLAADTARRTRLLTEDQKAAAAAENAVKAANAPRVAEEATVAQRAQDALRTNQGVDVARAGAVANAGAQTAAESGDTEYVEPGIGIGSHEELTRMERGQQNAAGAQSNKDIIAAAKEIADPEVSKGWTNDDWLTFGLAALATDSPYFLQGIGQAGLATQKQRQARTQQESTQQLNQAQIGKLKADTEYLQEQKGQNALRMKALSLAAADFEKWMTTAGLASTPEEQEAARKRITSYYMQQMGVTPATMGGTGIAGFKFLGAES